MSPRDGVPVIVIAADAVLTPDERPLPATTFGLQDQLPYRLQVRVDPGAHRWHGGQVLYANRWHLEGALKPPHRGDPDKYTEVRADAAGAVLWCHLDGCPAPAIPLTDTDGCGVMLGRLQLLTARHAEQLHAPARFAGRRVDVGLAYIDEWFAYWRSLPWPAALPRPPRWPLEITSGPAAERPSAAPSRDGAG